jgi:hypothetical protein
MPDKRQVLLIRITKNGNDPTTCIVKRHFVARKGSVVTFAFKEPGALITFPKDDSPFDEARFKPGKKVVRDGARKGPYKYRVSWPNGGGGVGQGNGTGEVIGR